MFNTYLKNHIKYVFDDYLQYIFDNLYLKNYLFNVIILDNRINKYCYYLYVLFA